MVESDPAGHSSSQHRVEPDWSPLELLIDVLDAIQVEISGKAARALLGR